MPAGSWTHRIDVDPQHHSLNRLSVTDDTVEGMLLSILAVLC
jgi:hypothetical protein